MLKSHIIAAEIPKLRRYARALVGNESEADDLVQDTLERALSRLHLWRGGDHRPVQTRRWLFTILHTLHIDGARGRARTPAHDDLDDTIRDPVTGPKTA